MKHQLVFSRPRNERNNYECGNPSENMLLLKEASGPRRSSRDLWRPFKKKRQTGKKTDAFFFQPASWTLHMQGKETIYIERDNNLYFTVKL